ncbi:MAG: hypothetical protein F4Y01_16415 [Gammaproteobacteria bacterium]|nr:hypothetical protein [Gammaproteobacteria bacterium]
MTARETPEIKRQARLRRVKDVVVSAVGIGIAVPLGFGVLFGGLFLFAALSDFDYEEYQRGQKLMECLKEAKVKRAADYCQVNWGPNGKHK